MNLTRLIDCLQRDDGKGGCPRKFMDGIAGLALAALLVCFWQSWEVHAQSPGTNPAAGDAERVPRVMLYEEDTNDPKGRRFRGSVMGRTEPVRWNFERMKELVIHADVEIPDRKLGVMWSLESVSDPYMTHIFTITFRMPLNFPAGTIQDVPGFLMKDGEQARGAPLRGHAVKVADGFFMIGLSGFDADRESNLRLLKTRPWFDIPIRYSNNRRAILAIEKGAQGERVFAEASATWGQ